MITNFKIFENKIQFKKNYSWTILGSKDEVINVLEHFYKIGNKTFSKSVLSIINDNDFINNYTDGIVLFCEDDYSASFILFEKDNLDEILDAYYEYDYQGELKIKNDKLVLDTLSLDIKKYNL